MWLATMETRHFDFDALGTTKDEALDALKAGLKVHADQVGLDPNWFEDFDINVRELEIGLAYRDGSALRP